MRYLVCLAVLMVTACSGPKKDRPVAETSPERVDDAIVIGDQPDPDTLKGSLRAVAMGSIGKAHIRVRYHSPGVRGRIVWGGLVPFDKVWVTGAHRATSFEVDRDISIDGRSLPAGKYAFFTFPGKETWTLVINRNWEQHLTDEYDAKLDVLRLAVKPAVRDVHQERLQYFIVQESERSGRVVMRWERLEVALPISVNP